MDTIKDSVERKILELEQNCDKIREVLLNKPKLHIREEGLTAAEKQLEQLKLGWM